MGSMAETNPASVVPSSRPVMTVARYPGACAPREACLTGSSPCDDWSQPMHTAARWLTLSFTFLAAALPMLAVLAELL